MDQLKHEKEYMLPFNIWLETMAYYGNAVIPFVSWIFPWDIVGELNLLCGYNNGIPPKSLGYHLW